jgi:hypothetical protein
MIQIDDIQHTLNSMAKDQTPQLKRDRYRNARGGRAAFMRIFCSGCGSWLMLYQKDGIGQLLRCYLNRIFAPPNLEALQREISIREPRDLEALMCPKCKALIGTPMRHEDGRLAFRLLRGTFTKKRGVE